MKKIICEYCKKNIPTKKNSIVLDGFFDQDTKQNVGKCCKQKHYKEKSKTEHKNLYSEFPIISI